MAPRGPGPLALVFACLVVGACAGAPPAEDADAKLGASHAAVQRAACLRPATSNSCDPGQRVTYKVFRESSWQPGQTWAREARKTGVIWCEAGRPRGRFSGFSTPSQDLERDVPQPVWEAIWRVLEATSGCASAYGAAVSVTRGGVTMACESPQFDMHVLFDIALRTARQGPPAPVRVQPAEDADELRGAMGICDIEPTACPRGPVQLPRSCPPFAGPLWPAGASRADAGSGEEGAAAALEDDEARGPEGELRPLANDPDPTPRPSSRDVVRALAKVMPAAKACISRGDPISRATITFRADGSVDGVTVAGGAAGKPSEACVRRVLSQARVPSVPGDEGHSVSVTIRATE